LKFSNDRSVCAPQYLSPGTCTSPKASVSALASTILYDVAWKFREKRGCVEKFESLWELAKEEDGVVVYIERAVEDTGFNLPAVEEVDLEEVEMKLLREAALEVLGLTADSPPAALAAHAELRSMFVDLERMIGPPGLEC
jgi:hypothetical protein